MANFDIANIALQSVCPNNAMILDDVGMPSVMVWVPKLRRCDVLSTDDETVLPAFIVDGEEIDGFWFGKYDAVLANGRAYSLPTRNPAGSMTIDQAVTYCTSKNNDNKYWHEVTMAEWAAVALWCHRHGCEPYGNNNSGKDTRETEYKAMPAAAGAHGKTLTGTGPLEWSHDRTLAGIWDLNGNIHKIVTGVRWVYGELQIIENNNACLPACDLSATSDEWKAIDASTGELITPDGSGTTDGSVKIDYVSSKLTYSTTITNQSTTSRSANFANATYDSTIGDEARLVLQSLALLPDLDLADESVSIDSSYGSDGFVVKNGSAEIICLTGATYNNGTAAGVFRFNFQYDRTIAASATGMRTALVEM